MSFYEDASLIILADGGYDGGIKAFKPADENLVPTGVGDLTVDRNSEATFVGSDKLIQTADANIPRFDYSNGSCPELLCEPQSTNLITYSEEFNNSSWAKNSSGTGVVPIVTANQGLSPDGTFNADRLQLN